MKGIRYRNRFNVDRVRNSVLYLFIVVNIILTNSTPVLGKSSENGMRNSESRTLSSLLNAAVSGLGHGLKPEARTFFGEDSSGNPIVIGSWFSYGSYTLAVAIFGTGFLVACAATAVYYVLFVVTDPRQTGFTRRRRRRSASATESIGKLFTTFDMALDIYEHFDWNNKDCRRKLWCRLNFDGESSTNRVKRTLSWFRNNWNPPEWKHNAKDANCSKIPRPTNATMCPFQFEEFENKIESLYK